MHLCTFSCAIKSVSDPNRHSRCQSVVSGGEQAITSCACLLAFCAPFCACMYDHSTARVCWQKSCQLAVSATTNFERPASHHLHRVDFAAAFLTDIWLSFVDCSLISIIIQIYLQTNAVRIVILSPRSAECLQTTSVLCQVLVSC